MMVAVVEAIKHVLNKQCSRKNEYSTIAYSERLQDKYKRSIGMNMAVKHIEYMQTHTLMAIPTVAMNMQPFILQLVSLTKVNPAFIDGLFCISAKDTSQLF